MTRRLAWIAVLSLTGLAVWLVPPRAAHQGRAAATRADALLDVLIRGVPHVHQRPDFCGEACLAMYLKRLGKPVDQDWVFDQTGVDPRLGRGAYTAELVRAARRIGFNTGDVWYKIPTARAATGLDEQFRALHADLGRGVPSIVCTRYDDRRGASEHFRLILGFDSRRDEVVYHEPAVAGGAYQRMKRAELLKLWPLHYDRDTLTVIRIRLEQGAVAVRPTGNGYSPAAYAQHVMALRKKQPPGFSVVISPPFVVIGDEAESVVKRRAEQTVRWAVEKLKAEYFRRDPSEIIDVWLFKDRESYERNSWKLFRDRPGTPYGYYSAEHRALVMNIATGGGTLVHEIVHPFVRANFPAAPAWLNEGLGSLYEQCMDKDGRIWGLPNWRLHGLQAAIRAGELQSFEKLTATTDRQFYREDSGTNYAQARYLLLYLQERGLLRRFYAEFAAGHRADPTGYRTLHRVLGNPDMARFQREWSAWVLGLKFP
jgi:hypothetical protein